MFMIFPTAEVVVALQIDLNAYRRQFRNEVVESAFPNREVSEDECFEIIYAMTDDSMNEHLLWVPNNSGTPQMDAVLRKLFPLWQQDEHVHASDHLFRQVLDECMIRVHHWVDFAMQSPSWNVWSLRRLGCDIVLEKGEDYRVLDWTRKMESGEWSDTSYRGKAVEDESRRTEKAMFREIVKQERATADHVLRLHGLPGLQGLDERGVTVLRMVLAERQGRTVPAAPRPFQARRYMARSIVPGVVEVYDTAGDEPAANGDTPPQESFVESLLADSPSTQKKRGKRS